MPIQEKVLKLGRNFPQVSHNSYFAEIWGKNIQILWQPYSILDFFC